MKTVMLKDVNVLVTAAGNVFMPGTAACIRNNGERIIRLIGVDLNKDETILQMFDAAYQVPRGDDPGYTDALLDICRKENVDILLPIMSVELNALAGSRARFEAEGTIISVSASEALTIANNKRRLFDYMKRNGLPCAEYQAVHSKEEVVRAARELGYPKKRVCIKAEEGSGSRGFRILDGSSSRFMSFLHEKPTSGSMHLEEFLDILEEAEEFPTLIVMEYLPGEEYSVDLLADKGRVLYAGCRRSLRMENSIMLEAEVVDNETVLDLCRLVTEKLELDGNIGFDIRERSDGTPFIMECNPRITAGIPFFALAGLNLPYLCIKKLLGEDMPAVKPVYGTVVRRRWLEMSAQESF